MEIHLCNKFAKDTCGGTAIVVDVLRASTTITTLLSFIDEVYITTSTIKKENAICIGERNGVKIENFDFGNSPTEILENKDIIKERYENGERVILTTTNGTRVLKNLDAETILIGCIINAKYVAKVAEKYSSNDKYNDNNKSNSCISLVPCHRKGNFAIDDFIGCGLIAKYLNGKFDEFITAALELAKHDWATLIMSSSSANHLISLGYEKDIIFAMLENSINAVGIYDKKNSKVIRVK